MELDHPRMAAKAEVELAPVHYQENWNIAGVLMIWELQLKLNHRIGRDVDQESWVAVEGLGCENVEDNEGQDNKVDQG